MEIIEKLINSMHEENPWHMRITVNHLKKDGSMVRTEIRTNAIGFQGGSWLLVLAIDITAKLMYLGDIEAQNGKRRAIA